MTPADLIKGTRQRHGLSQRRLALRAGTSQAAIARIERGEEQVTRPRLRAILLSMGEEPVLMNRPAPSRYDPADLLRDRHADPAKRLKDGLELNEFAGRVARAGQLAKAGDGTR